MDDKKDHGGADAGVVWRSISEDTRWIDGRDVVLLANDMEVQARYCPGEWCDETPSSPREYSGAVWSCFDDQFQLEIEECSEDPSEWCHDGATHWRPISALSKPAPVAANASAEARLREALEQIIRYCDESTDPVIALTAKKALSAHSPASDCDNPIPEGLQKTIDDTRAAMDRELSSLPKLVYPSDRTADVTEEELAKFVNHYTISDKNGQRCARVLLDAFTVRKRLCDKQGK